MQKVKFTIITLFPEALEPYLSTSMMWKAREKGILSVEFVNLRDFGLGPHQSVDDTPYGGGDGMVLRVEPIFAAVEQVFKTAEDAGEKRPEVILPTPDGELWTESLARELAGVIPPRYDEKEMEKSIAKATSPNSTPTAESKHYLIICPHYEGYDARILTLVDRKICLGPYVLTGGELPALVIIDSVVRLLPGVLGGATSAQMESFSGSDGHNIEAPQYTKPQEFRGMKVPDILLSGDHGKVAKWRKSQEKSLKF